MYGFSSSITPSLETEMVVQEVLEGAFSGKSNPDFLLELSPHQGGCAALNCCREHLRVSCQGQSPSLYLLLEMSIFNGFDS